MPPGATRWQTKCAQAARTKFSNLELDDGRSAGIKDAGYPRIGLIAKRQALGGGLSGFRRRVSPYLSGVFIRCGTTQEPAAAGHTCVAHGSVSRTPAVHRSTADPPRRTVAHRLNRFPPGAVGAA